LLHRHPQSIDALCTLPDSLPNVDSASTILTGSSDGLVRVVDVFPTKLSGIAADHGDFPVERIAVSDSLMQATLSSKDSDNERDLGRWWIGSIGHDDNLKLTSLGELFGLEDEGNEEASKEEHDVIESEDCSAGFAKDADSSSEDSEAEQSGKRKRKRKKDSGFSKKKDRREVSVEPKFFDDL
jgi:WD repeat-containing protein 55